MIEVKVTGLMLDPALNRPVMLLRELAGERVLSIWIGQAEALAIAYALEGVKFPRPLTVDFAKRVLDGVGARATKVIVTALKNDTFYATVVLETDGKMVSIDARPSDSVALALRAGCPIFVEEAVMDACAAVMTKDDAARVNELRAELKKIDPEHFGDVGLT